MNWKQLNTEYPFEQTSKEKLNVILFVSVSASLIVLLLQPFGFSITEQTLSFFSFLFVAVLTLSVNYFAFPFVFPSIFEEHRWSISKAFLFLLYNFIIIGFWIHIVNAIIVKKSMFFIHSKDDLLAMLFRTIAVGVITTFFLILIKYNILARQHLQISQSINDELKTQLAYSNEDKIELYLENNTVSFSRDDLKYISAEGNYIKLHFRGIENKVPKLYRARLKQIEASLDQFPEFFRCHRSFIINLNTVESSTGNSQGLFIKMLGGDKKIPVARPKIKLLKHHLNEIKNN